MFADSLRMPLTIVVFSSNLVSESINAPTTFASAFLRAFCDASSKVEPKPFVITVFTLLAVTFSIGSSSSNLGSSFSD